MGLRKILSLPELSATSFLPFGKPGTGVLVKNTMDRLNKRENDLLHVNRTGKYDSQLLPGLRFQPMPVGERCKTTYDLIIYAGRTSIEISLMPSVLGCFWRRARFWPNTCPNGRQEGV
jgi:hypothetical protein